MTKPHKPCYCTICMRDRYCSPCRGCKDGHPSFWKTVIESPQWKEWQEEQMRRFNIGKIVDGRFDQACYDMPEVEELGCISPEHFQDFLNFTIWQASQASTQGNN